MKMKLALFLGVLVLLTVAQLLGDDLQVKGNKGNGLNSVSNSNDGGVEGNGSQVGKNSDPGFKKNLKKKPEIVKVVDKVSAEVVPDDRVYRSKKKKNKKGLESDKGTDNGNSTRIGIGKDYDAGAVSDRSRSLDGLVKLKESNGNQGGEDQWVDLKKKEISEESNNNNNHNDVENGGSKKNNGTGEMLSKDWTGNKGSGIDAYSIGDECYSSVMCSDKENQLIACLRVPGNESPRLSLLIRNKGNDTLRVLIFAPDFVELESTKVELQANESKKVDVSIGSGGKKSLIILTSGERVCILDFNDLMVSSRNYK